jgi:RNA polymerase sigma factor (TIGR02999 family)
MRHILVDYARARQRLKRGSGVAELPLHDAEVGAQPRVDELLAVHSALENLTALDPRKAKVFELRYFGGMSVDEAAEVLNVSAATVARDWRMAKAWLWREIRDGSQHGAPDGA